MLDRNFNKPIPKYMLNLIKKTDKKCYKYPSSVRRFYSYFTKYKGELIKVTVAVKHKNNNWYCKQVAVHGIDSENCLLKDLEYSYIFGYCVGWYSEGIADRKKNYETDYWCYAEDKYYDPFAPVLNKEYILKQEEFKYSAIDKYYFEDVMKYLKLYRKYPLAEMLVKLGLSKLATSKSILTRLEKDKKFRKWIVKNNTILMNHYFYINAIISAYKGNKDLLTTQRIEEIKKRYITDKNCKIIKKYIKTSEYLALCEYLSKQNADLYIYEDYLSACEKLGLDLRLNKNKYPKEFMRWHDIRIDEYHTKRAFEEEQAKKELYTQFSNISNKYLTLQRNLKDDFVVIIAKSPADLLFEGERLNHCVGRMNYDKRFIREESLIFFIRNKNSIDTPFVTMEYSLKNKKILQCYGEHDSRPDEKVLDFAYKVWLPYANRKIKKIA